jgi:erythromycin esterase-like protein
MSAQLSVSAAITAAAQPLTGAVTDLDALVALASEARFVLLGEATHGTDEFYQLRAAITRRLIVEHGFSAVAVEADWPDAYRVNRFVRGNGDDGNANQALSGFQRFPSWMWRNTAVCDFVDWLAGHNAPRPDGDQVGFYGLDLYSMTTSIDEVLRYLAQVDPQAAHEARQRYACFDHFAEDSREYGFAASVDHMASCEQGAVEQLRQMQQRAAEYLQTAGPDEADAFYYAQQNARLVKNAEEYYRTMFHGGVSSWNLRDQHMAETLDALEVYLSEQLPAPAKIVVWEHNSHIGDARATEVGEHGELNLGQLARERYPGETCLIGFSTYEGTVTAASRWDGPAQCKRVRPALAGSYEDMFHQTGLGNFYLPLAADNEAHAALLERRLERAIGVLYLPRSERQSHYFYAQLPAQFDAVVHLDRTSAVRPLDPDQPWHSTEPPETFPAGL